MIFIIFIYKIHSNVLISHFYFHVCALSVWWFMIFGRLVNDFVTRKNIKLFTIKNKLLKSQYTIWTERVKKKQKNLLELYRFQPISGMFISTIVSKLILLPFIIDQWNIFTSVVFLKAWSCSTHNKAQSDLMCRICNKILKNFADDPTRSSIEPKNLFYFILMDENLII